MEMQFKNHNATQVQPISNNEWKERWGRSVDTRRGEAVIRIYYMKKVNFQQK